MVTNEYNEEVEPKVLVASEELKTFTESTMEINKSLQLSIQILRIIQKRNQ